MTPLEEKELESLLDPCVNGLTDIDELAHHLGSTLTALETENIYGIIESELAVLDVQHRIEETGEQLEAIDAWLGDYSLQLKSIKQYIEQIENKNNRMEVITRNQKVLLDEVEKLLKKLFLNRTATAILLSPNFTEKELSTTNDAADELSVVFQVYDGFDPNMKKMKAVQEKMKEFEALKTSFAGKLNQFIQDLFVKLTTHLESKLKGEREEVTWFTTAHGIVFRSLLPYAPLVEWLQQMDKERYQKLLSGPQSYCQTFKTIYKREMKELFSELKRFVSKEHSESKILSLGPVVKRNRQGTLNFSSPPKPEKMPYDSLFGYCLTVVIVAVMEEQKFCRKFFPPPIVTDSTKEADAIAEKSGQLEILLSELFDGLTVDLLNLMEATDKSDHLGLITILSYIEQGKAKCENSVYLTRVLEELETKARQMFNTFISDQVNSANSSQTSIKRCGILPFFSKMPLAVDHMESRAGSSKMAREVVEGAYNSMISSSFTWLQQLGEQQKEKFRYIVRLENFHHFYVEMKKRGVQSVTPFVEQAKEQYQSNMLALVELLINSKFKRLTGYFNEIDNLLKTLPAEEIQYQQSHSKQALAKISSKTGASSVEEKLSKLNKNVSKNLSQEEGLASEVWDALADFFTQKYQHFENLTARCYKNVQLPLTSDRLLEIIRSKRFKE